MTPLVIIIAATGFVTNKIYHFRIKSVHSGTDGWNLVFNSLILGCINQLPLYLFFLYEFEGVRLLDLKEELIVLYFLASFAISIILAFIYSSQTFQSLQTWALESLISDKQEVKPVGQTSTNLHKLMNKRVLLGLRSGKVYVGRLINIDTNDNIKFENRGLEIFPIKSGYRGPYDKQIVYTTPYIMPEKELAPNNITIKLSDIETFTEYSAELDEYFSQSNEE